MPNQGSVRENNDEIDGLHASGMSLDQQKAQNNFEQNSIEDNEANKKLTGEEDCKA